MSEIRNYKCNRPDCKGTVQIFIKETKNNVQVDVKRCDKCKYQFGLKYTESVLTRLP